MISYNLNSSHRKTLQAVFKRPTRTDLRWSRSENLIEGLGGKVTEGRGSRVRFQLGVVVATFHRPHAPPRAGKGTVEDVRTFLQNAGVRI